MTLYTLFLLMILAVQFVALAASIRWRTKRVERRYPERSPTPQNGKSHHAHYKAAQIFEARAD